MRKHHLAAGIAALTLIPGLAMAQVTCEQRSQNRAAGTAVGAVAGHHDRGTGAVVGGVGGAIVGNQLARGPRDCAHAYGWYDNDGRWHGQRVSESSAYGYYDRSGTWIDGRPAGRWSNGVYIADAGAYGTNTAYVTREHTNDIQTRLERMDNWIDRARENGRLSYREARNAQMQLNDIRREARYRTRDGYLSGREEARLQTRLDRLAQQIRFDANS